MDEPCFRPEDAASVLARIEEPAVRAHLDACPACRTLVVSYRAFLAGEDAAGPQVSAVEEYLRARIEDLTRTPPARRRPAVRSTTLRWRRLAGFPRRRGVVVTLASAAALAVVVFHFLRGPTRPADAPLYRGAPPAEAPASAAVRLPDGSVRLTWPSIPDAAGYRLQILSPAMKPLRSVTVTGDTTATLDTETLARLGEPQDAPLLWDLAPIVRGDTLAPGVPRVLPRE